MLIKPTPAVFRKRPPKAKRPAPSGPPVPVHVVQVVASFESNFAVWHLGRAVSVLAGATFEMFVLNEEGGTGHCVGVHGSVVGGNQLVIQMDTAPFDGGNGWFWEVESSPVGIVASDGGRIVAESGDVTFQGGAE